MRGVAGLYMGLYTILGKEREHGRLVAGTRIPDFRTCIPLFTAREMYI